MASTFACHLVGPWLFNNATCVAGSSLGLPLELGGYSLPNTIITPIKHCQPAWAEVPVKAGVDPRGLGPLRLKPHPRAGLAAKGSGGSGMASPQTSGSLLSAHLGLLPVLPTASPGPSTQGL